MLFLGVASLPWYMDQDVWCGIVYHGGDPGNNPNARLMTLADFIQYFVASEMDWDSSVCVLNWDSPQEVLSEKESYIMVFRVVNY